MTAKDYLKCLQQVLRPYGFAVPISGLWDSPTRKAAYQYAYGTDVPYPSIGTGTLWIREALGRHGVAVQECMGSGYAYSKGFEAALAHIIEVESSGQTEQTTEFPWLWVVAGAVAVGVASVTVYLWKRR